ncbi:hypothetical protein [Mumia sp. Pv 4-285]|uniref:hypothetical protein n=1 Tax=Mumia qirimensis TaxID=3234852 RepID=UPI00351D815A
MKILLWLAVPLAVTALAMVWAAWYARRGADESARGGARPGRTWGPGDPAYARFSDAVRRPLPEAVHARQAPQRASGVVVRRSGPVNGKR